MFSRLLVACGLVALVSSCASWEDSARAHDVFGPWPEGRSPLDIGHRVAERYLARAPGPARDSSAMHYAEVCTWLGALRFAASTHDSVLRARLVDRLRPLFAERSFLIPPANHVDNTVFAAVPLEIAAQTGDPRARTLGMTMADRQWGVPFGPYADSAAASWLRQGYSWQTRLWIDDMFMITAVQAQATRVSRDPRYRDRAAREMVMYLDTLQRSNGLFFHAPDVPVFWGRGNGWMAAGMSELLRGLPLDHPDRPRILAGYRAMMASLLRYQDEEGMWHQVIDHPESWKETSCTGMFTFAFIVGVQEGWLDEDRYRAAARKGWLALAERIDGQGEVRDVCEGTAKKNDLQYYFDRKRNVGDMHGQAPILWCAAAMMGTLSLR